MSTLLLLPNQEESWASVKLVCDYTIKQARALYDNLDIYYVRRDEVFKNAKSFMKYEKIICLDHCVESFKLLALLKSLLKDDLVIEFYALGMASSYYWPLIKFGLARHLSTKDKFVVSCFRDIELTRQCFSNAQVELRSFEIRPRDELRPANKQRLVYIGRLSFQKNLHGLLLFFSHYKKSHPGAVLELFGDWDNLDLPYFEMKMSSYKDYILDLVNQLGLSDEVIFHGPKTEEQIDQLMQEGSLTFISLSLQTDENFGIAAYKALSFGHRAILSNWGGHAQLKELFGESVYLVQSAVSKNGPGLVLKNEGHYIIPELGALDIGASKIVISDFAQNFCKRRDQFMELKSGDVIYRSFKDPIFLNFCLSYSGTSEFYTDEDIVEIYDCPQLFVD